MKGKENNNVQRTKSGPMALSQPGSVLKSVVPVIIEGHGIAQGLDEHLKLCWSSGTMLLLGQ